MKQTLLTICAFFLMGAISPLASSAQEESSGTESLPSTLEETLAIGLPVVDIYTDDGVEPPCETILPPEGCIGTGITGADKIPGSVIVYNADGSVAYESGPYQSKTSGITIKVRGNSSASGFDKKPYKIKLQKKADMLSRGDSRYKDKNWVLIKGASVFTHLSNRVAAFMGQPWTPEYMFVNVRINGDFRGVYCLSESIEQNEDCRIAVSDDGFVMEHDPYWWNENGEYLVSLDWSPRINYTFKYPDYEDASDEQLEIIQNILNRYEESVNTGLFGNVIDVESFANWSLCHDIIGTSDGAGANLYLCKNSIYDDSPITAGPLWDFDSAFAREMQFSGSHRDTFRKFFNQKQTIFFRKAYADRWYRMRDQILAEMLRLVDDLSDKKWEPLSRSIALDNQRWAIQKEKNLDVLIPYLKEWIPKRFDWLDSAIAGIDRQDPQIEKVEVSHKNLEMHVGDWEMLSAEVIPVYYPNRNVIWESSDPEVATVDASGFVRAVGLGETTIIAFSEADREKADVCNVSVTPILATEITVDHASTLAMSGDTFTLKATVLPDNVTDPGVEWLSSDTSVATVDEAGTVRVHDGGKCFIFALTTDGSFLSAWCLVNAESSGVVGVEYTEVPTLEVYTLSGHLVGTSLSPEEFNSLQPGIYVVNGVKVSKRR